MDYSLLLPEFLLVGLAFVVMGVDLLLGRGQKGVTAWVAVLGLLVVAASALTLRGKDTSVLGEMILVDQYAVFFKYLFPLIAVFIILTSIDYVKKFLSYPGEYYGFIIFATAGMLLMTAAGELLTAYIGLELLSFSLYVLACFDKDNPKSTEAGIKYVLLGAFSSALLLYGISLIYGVARTTTYSGIAAAIAAGPAFHPTLLVGLILIIAGLGFKMAAVPFHMWAPDVYEGAPTPITAYLSVASKAAAFGLALRLFGTAFLPAADLWRWAIVIIAAVSMTLGNLVAIHQTNIKRLLAYSSIGQAGYILTGIAALAPWGDAMAASAILFHIAGYAVSNLSAFTCVIIYSNLTEKENIADYAGLAERAPFVAFALTVSLLSLAGLPFFAGFITKFYLFAAAANAGLLWLVALAVVVSLISFYYYLLVVRPMYVSPPSERVRLPVPALLHGVLGVLILGVVLIGLWPAPLVNLVTLAAAALFG